MMKSFKTNSVNWGNLTNFALFAGIALIGWKIYNNFFKDSPADVAKDIAEKNLAIFKTDTQTSQSDSLATQKTELEKRGLFVTSLHKTIANNLYNEINATWQDDDKIVSIIKGIKTNDTLKLVSQAYGIRDLNNYAKTHFHLDALITMPWNNYMEGDLKYHLTKVLSDSAQKQIQSKLSII